MQRRKGFKEPGKFRDARNQSDTSLTKLTAQIRFKPISPNLFNTIAENAAKEVANSASNKPTQLRRFYDELCLWELRVAQEPAKFSEYLPFIRMLNAKVAYAFGRKVLDDKYVTLFHHTLSQVEDPKSLTTCKLFWEAFTGFYKRYKQD